MDNNISGRRTSGTSHPPVIVSGTEIHDRITGLPSWTLIIIFTSPHTLANVSLAIFSMWTISTGSTSYSTPTQCIAISSLRTLVISVASPFTISIPTIFSLRTITAGETPPSLPRVINAFNRAMN